MPVARSPDTPEFFVYAFVVNDYPFYVGLGRAGRASMRLSYVRNLMKREQQGKSVKWVASTWVIAELVRRGIEPQLKPLVEGVVRSEASRREKEIIAEYRAAGIRLANRVFNGGSAVAKEQVLAAVLKAKPSDKPSGIDARQKYLSRES
jgi:hypothetical protein